MKKKNTPTSEINELRRQAEAKLSRRTKEATAPAATKVEIQRLVHELQVHQIELEMQNEELMQSRAELESTLNLYTELYAFAPVGYFTLMRDGTIRRANLTGAKLLNKGLANLIKRHFEIFISVQSRTIFRTFLDKVFISEKKEVCDVTLQNDGPAALWVHIEAVVESAHGHSDLCYVIVSDITERKQAEEELRRLSTHDSLTGLYNHSFFFEEMARVERGRQFPVSIVMADVDHLKEINDQQGHAAGDALIQRIAQVLVSAFRVEDVVARIGGDEFAVLLPGTDAASAKVSLQRVQQVIQEHNATHPETPIRFSLGMSTADSPMPLSVVLKKADVNMYREKQGDNGA